jgi:hypothetical protein
MKRYLSATCVLLGLGISILLPQSPKVQQPPAQGDGAVVCYNFVHNGQKPNCSKTNDPKEACNKECVGGKPALDIRCRNHCKESMCKCRTKCQT